MSKKSAYRLRCTLEGHSKDVRAVAVASDSQLISGSRDRTVKIWDTSTTKDSNSSSVITLPVHPKYVSSVAFSPSDGFVITGCNDGLIRAYDLTDSTKSDPVYVLEGHTDTVSCLFFGKFSTLVSGSWDATAKVWTGRKCVITLSGHDAAVWAVGILPEVGITITGSADKTIRLWKAGSVVETLVGHTDCVRAIAVLSPREFLSASNDATVKKWDANKGCCLATYYGHDNYIYSLSLGSNFDFVTSGEDRSIRIWKDGKVDQTLRVPAQSVWSVTVLENGDIAAGTSGGKIWIFTTDESREASAEVVEIYENELSKQQLAAETELGGIKVSDLPGPESLLEPGKRDGQTKMVRTTEGTVSAHSWSESEGKWTKIGDVIGADNTKKKLFEGKEYDYVFDIDLDEPPRVIKLPYNCSEEPWVVAQKFIHDNDLPQMYLEQIADFIFKNTNGEKLGDGSSRVFDPLTGGSAYTTSSNGPSPESMSMGSNTFFPQKAFLSFLTPPKVEAMKTKLREFNDQVDPEQKISEADLEKIPLLCSEDGDVKLLIKILRWPLDKIFPGLDVLRLAIRNSKVNDHLLKSIDLVVSILLTNLEPGSSVPCTMLALRTLVNLFGEPRGLEALVNLRESVVNRVMALLPAENKNVQIALTTLVLNYSVALIDEDEGQVQIISAISLLFFEGITDPEAKFRTLVAFGTLLTRSDSNVSLARGMDAKDRVRNWKLTGETQKIRECAAFIDDIL